MPLAERDVNSQRQRPLIRGKRFQIAASVSDENAGTPSIVRRAQETPTRQQRFLAPTKASVAKNASSSPTGPSQAYPHSDRSTQSQTQSSRIARRHAATPIPKPSYISSDSKCDSLNAASLNPQSRKTPKDLPISLCPQVSRGTACDRSLMAHEILPSTPLAHAEKPLPSRPIASLVYAQSPSRDSRSLIDASERLLRQSDAGLERDWPTLIPNSQSTFALVCTPSRAAMSDLESIPVRLPASASLSAAPAATAANVTSPIGREIRIFESGSVGFSSSSTTLYVGTSEVAPVSEPPETSCQNLPRQTQDVDPMEEMKSIHLPRKSSLPNPDCNASPLKRSQSIGLDVSGHLDFGGDTFEASRPHSPSPASFSRPRPTSISEITSMTPVKSQKTASRIPLADQKKATLVEIKGRRLSGIPVPKFDRGLSFGGRRIDSPDPLKVLDHGIKRRRLQRPDTGGSSSTASTVPTRFLGNATSPVNHSKSNTPDGTTGSSSEEEVEIATPSDKPIHFIKYGYKPKHAHRASVIHYSGATLKLYDEAEVIPGKPPPSNSPFTGPLQTIPSSSILPPREILECDNLEPDSRFKVVIKPTEFSTFAQRLSLLQDLHGLFDTNPCAHKSVVCDDTKSELVDILREAEHEDALISQCGSTGLDAETKESITSTLGMLEGRCGPVSTTVDLDELSHMFGRLKTGFEQAPKSAAFVEDATVAERFLAMKESKISENRDIVPCIDHGESYGTHPAPCKDQDAASQVSRSKTVASKWSKSTVSAREKPLHSTDAPLLRDTFGMEFEDISPALPPKDLATTNSKSIGYPSRTSRKAHRLLGTDDRSLGVHKTANHRDSSLTPGAPNSGSVRVSRDMACEASGSHVKMLNESKVEKLLNPNTRVFEISEHPPRGRLQSSEMSGRRDSRKLPRSRSKSRYVLDKINGLFSGRRDKRNSMLPPLPPAKNSLDHERLISTPKEVRISSLKSHMLRTPRTSPLTKMPTMSPPVDSVHPALRSGLSSVSVDPSAVTIGSDAEDEGRRSLQNLSENLLGRAMKEGDPAKKERLLNFAKVLNDSLISAREAQISAETAQTAAHSARLSYEMTMKSVAMLQRLASGMNRR